MEISIEQKKELLNRDFNLNRSEFYLHNTLQDILNQHKKFTKNLTYDIEQNIIFSISLAFNCDYENIKNKCKTLCVNGTNKVSYNDKQNFFNEIMLLRLYLTNDKIKGLLDYTIYTMKELNNEYDLGILTLTKIKTCIIPIFTLTKETIILAITVLHCMAYNIAINKDYENKFNNIYADYEKKHYDLFTTNLYQDKPHTIKPINILLSDIEALYEIYEKKPNNVKIETKEGTYIGDEAYNCMSGNKRNIKLNKIDMEQITFTKKSDFITKKNDFKIDGSKDKIEMVELTTGYKNSTYKPNELINIEKFKKAYFLDTINIRAINTDKPINIAKLSIPEIKELWDLIFNKFLQPMYDYIDKKLNLQGGKITKEIFNDNIDLIKDYIKSFTTQLKAYDEDNKEIDEPILFNMALNLNDFNSDSDEKFANQENYVLRQKYFNNILFLTGLRCIDKRELKIGSIDSKPEETIRFIPFFTDAVYLSKQKAMLLHINENIILQNLRNYFIDKTHITKKIDKKPRAKGITATTKKITEFYELYLQKTLQADLSTKIKNFIKNKDDFIKNSDNNIKNFIKQWYAENKKFQDNETNKIITPYTDFTMEKLKTQLANNNLLNIDKTRSKNFILHKIKDLFNKINDIIEYVAPEKFKSITKSRVRKNEEFNKIVFSIKLKLDDEELDKLINRYINNKNNTQ